MQKWEQVNNLSVEFCNTVQRLNLLCISIEERLRRNKNEATVQKRKGKEDTLN